MNKKIKRVIICLAVIIGSVVLLAVIFLGVLTIAEYRPDEIVNLEINNPVAVRLSGLRTETPFSVLIWNIGYASLDESQDFIMDGGKGVRPPTDENVKRNLQGIREFITGTNSDIILIQEIDIASKRSYYIDQRQYLTENFAGSSAFAYNFNSIFVPIPFPEFIGKVESGLLNLSRFRISEAFRVSLPNPFTWPVRAVNLKRCLLVSRHPLDNSAAELVIINLHLEAYDTSGGREAQTKAMLDFMYSEYAKGNYVIAGGDFNQNFPGINPHRFAVINSEYFIPGNLSLSLLAPGWQYAAGTLTPTARLLNEPFSGDLDNTQLYLIDGFIISPNVELINVTTYDLGFIYSDHNPVRLEAILK
ncbi:MAG: endonuclease/exonuclease/phosphatase family protein [Treponema sp.]|nr:endonuclease/exonuclease/phosphatase family protein [Treponema sp.]